MSESTSEVPKIYLSESAHVSCPSNPDLSQNFIYPWCSHVFQLEQFIDMGSILLDQALNSAKRLNEGV